MEKLRRQNFVYLRMQCSSLSICITATLTEGFFTYFNIVFFVWRKPNDWHGGESQPPKRNTITCSAGNREIEWKCDGFEVGAMFIEFRVWMQHLRCQSRQKSKLGSQCYIPTGVSKQNITNMLKKKRIFGTTFDMERIFVHWILNHRHSCKWNFTPLRFHECAMAFCILAAYSHWSRYEIAIFEVEMTWWDVATSAGHCMKCICNISFMKLLLTRTN